MSVKLNEALKEISRLQHSENVWRKHAETLQSSIAMVCDFNVRMYNCLIYYG